MFEKSTPQPADHDFDFRCDLERFLEQKIECGLATLLHGQGLGAKLDLQPVVEQLDYLTITAGDRR